MKRRPHHPPRNAESNSDVRHHSPGSKLWIYGHHAVAAALGNPQRKILRLMATEEAYEKLAREPNVEPDALKRANRSSRREIDTVVGETAIHQGVALQTEPLVRRIEDVLDSAVDHPSMVVVVLDQITDPHNAGAIARSAAALGACALITSSRHAPSEGGVLHKAASGALERLAFIQVVNIARAIEQLKDKGFWVVGLAGDTDRTLSSIDLKGRVAFVLGTEDEGLRRLVRESCDFVARLPIETAVESLNVSNAAAVALYERARQIGRA